MFIHNRDIINMLIIISPSDVIVNSIICDQREKQHMNIIVSNIIQTYI